MLMFAVVATLLPSLTTVWISYIENKRALQGKASEELLAVSARAIREVDLWSKGLRLDLRVFMSSYEVTDNLERIPQVNGEPAHAGIYYTRLGDFLNSVRDRFPDYTELMVLDQHGHMVATSAAAVRPVSLPPDWSKDLSRNGWSIGPPYWDSTGTHAEMLVSVPIESGRRAGRSVGGTRVIGAIAARVNLHSVVDTLRRFAPGDSGQIYLMTRSGRIIVSSRGSSRELMRQGYSRETANRLLAQDGRAIQFGSYTGERVLGSARVVPAVDWLVVSEISTAEAFAQVARLRNITLGVVTLLLAVLGGLAYLLSMFSVVMADVDLFKKYNDEFGHPAGDVVLKRVAAIMREASRDVDFVARYGGEEFLIMMPETELAGATQFAERIRKKLGSEKLPAGKITLSLGVAAFPMHGDGADQLIAEADAALYLAKRAGGDQVMAAARPKVPAK